MNSIQRSKYTQNKNLAPPRSSPAHNSDVQSEQTDDFLSSVIAEKLESASSLSFDKGSSSLTGTSHLDPVEGVSVPQVVEESGPVQYEEGEEGLDDEEMEELVYEEDPLLHSDYEDEGVCVCVEGEGAFVL